MMFEKTITVNLGNYESVKLSVSECESFQQCDYELEAECQRLGINSKAVKA